MSRRRRALTVVVALGFLFLLPSPMASAAVSVTRAELSGSNLRLEGTATASRDITVDSVVMGRSDSGGRFRIERSGYTAPADCTVDVNDGSATPRTVSLTGCTVTTPPPPPPSSQSAPAPLSPPEAGQVLSPVTLSWSQVLNPDSVNGGYNWQISASPTFGVIVTRDSTRPSVTEVAVGGLATGTYYWQVQAVSADLVVSAWSSARSFVVTGAAPGALGAPVLDPLPFGTRYHPMESFTFSWSAVPGASTYLVEADRDPTFAAPVDIRIDNVTRTTDGLTIHDSLRGDFSLRVRAIGPDGVAGPVSNVRSFSISYDAPVGPAPTLAAPATGVTRALPLLLDWNDVANPQSSGYEAQVASSSSFADVEIQISGQTSSRYELLSLPAGTHFWRVRHHQGMASATTTAVTAWSEVRSFTIASGPVAVSSLWLGAPPCTNPCPGTESLDSGQEIVVSLQLTGEAPAGGLDVAITSSNQTASGTHPSTVHVPAGLAYTQFRLFAGQVSEPTPVTLTATLGSSAAQASFVVRPTVLERLSFCCDSTGGLPAAAHLAFTGQVPPAGASVSLSSDLPVARPPATVTVPGGSFSAPISIPTDEVAVVTTAVITATWNGSSVSAPLKLYPQQPPTSLVLDRTSATGSEWANGTVRIAEGQQHEVLMRLTSSHPDIARTPPYAQIGFLSTVGGFTVTTTAPTTSTEVTISASGAGTTLRTTLTVHPAGGPAAALSGLSLAPSTVTGGSGSSTGTVTLTAAAPPGGASIALVDSGPAAGVPASVTVPAGSSSATFPVSTTAVSSSTQVTVSATYVGVTRSAVLTVSPQASTTLPAPILISPAAGARFPTGRSVVFDWGDVGAAASYILQVSGSSTFSTVQLTRTVTTSTVSTTFSTEGSRFWRVRATSSDGTAGAWSSVRDFRIKN